MSTSLLRMRARHPGLRSWSGKAAACAVLVAGLSATGLLAGTGAPAGAAGAATTIPYSTGKLPLHVVGTVNLTHLAGMPVHPATTGRSTNWPHHVTPLGLLHHAAGTSAARRSDTVAPSLPRAILDRIGGNVKGQVGFNGVDALINSSHNSPTLGGVGDVTPPDQGLGVGPSPRGTAVVEMVNDTLDIYAPSGKALIAPLATFQVFDQPPATFMSDPRVYWDPASGHWFLTMFAIGTPGGSVGGYGCDNGGAVENGCLSAQFIAVSVTTNPLGSYKVFWFDTSDGSNSTSEAPGPGGHIGDDCPCFGDYDMVGINHSGLYITTNEFCYNGSSACSNSVTGTFNGTVIYALPKRQLVAAAAGGTPPTIVKYGVDYSSDPFAAYHLSPSAVTQGSAAPNTEYFVESNANLPSDPSMTTTGLEVFALLRTGTLGQGGTPPLVMTKVATEKYTALPPNAAQKSGPIPFGNLLGQGTTPALQTDFNAVQEVTYAGGLLYAELDTTLALGQQMNSGAAWFALRPTPTTSSIGVTKVGNGYVEASQDILYPDIGVNANGQGYMTFALAGPDMYPSAAYVTFNGAHGPVGHHAFVAAAGVKPLDDFSCYPPFGSACRYGDYSMAQAFNGHIYMADEYVPPLRRDTYANWGTRVFSAPIG